MKNNRLKISKNILIQKVLTILTLMILSMTLMFPLQTFAEDNTPTIKLNINGTYKINPYDYVKKTDVGNNTQLDFNITNSQNAGITVNKDTSEVNFIGKAAGNSVFTISIQGKVVYTINVNVNANNKNEATNLNPIPR